MEEIIQFREDPTKAIRTALRWYDLRDSIRDLEVQEAARYVPNWKEINEIIDRAYRIIDAPSVIERMAQRDDPMAQEAVWNAWEAVEKPFTMAEIDKQNKMHANMNSRYRRLSPGWSVIPGKSGQQLEDAIKNLGGGATLE